MRLTWREITGGNGRKRHTIKLRTQMPMVSPVLSLIWNSPRGSAVISTIISRYISERSIQQASERARRGEMSVRCISTSLRSPRYCQTRHTFVRENIDMKQNSKSRGVSGRLESDCSHRHQQQRDVQQDAEEKLYCNIDALMVHEGEGRTGKRIVS